MQDSRENSRPSHYRWLVFALLSAGYLLVYFHRLCPAVVALELMDDLNAGAGVMGLLASAYFYPYAVMQIPSGLLSDSWGPRKTITLFFVLAGAASIGLGFAQTAGQAVIARVLVGLGVSMLFVPTMKVLTHWFRTSEFAFMTGLLMAVGGLGALSAATPLAHMSSLVGWRGSFIATGVATLALAGGIWLFVRDRPVDLGMPAIQASEPSGEQPKRAIALWDGMLMVVRKARFWPLAAWFFFTFGIFFSFAGLWGGPYLMHLYSLSKSEAGDILSMFAVAMVIGSPTYSLLSNRIRSRKKPLVVSSAVVVVLTVPLAFFPAGLNVPFLYVWSFLLGVSASAVVVIGFTSAKELFPVEIAGTSVGLVNLFPFLGGAIMQPTLGLVLDGHGRGPDGYSPEAYASAFLLYFAAAILAFVGACCTEETVHPASAQ